MAVTGPFRTTIATTPTYYHWYESYRQTPPFRERLPYKMVKRFLVKKNFGSANVSNASYDALDSDPAYQAALNQAYDRFTKAVHEKASLAVSLAERKQAIEMVSKRLTQLYQFSRNLRKGDIAGALKAVGWKPKPTERRKRSNFERDRVWTSAQRRANRKKRPLSDTFNEAFDGFDGPPRVKSQRRVSRPDGTLRTKGEKFSDLYLELNFGWIPVVKDIGAAVDVLQKPFSPVTARGKGSSFAKTGVMPAPGSYSIESIDDWSSGVILRADIEVTNPNLYLANQLGFTNPASLVWELIPFSFLVDWVSNVSQFLAQWTEFLGLTLKRSTTTHFLIHTNTDWYGSYPPQEVHVIKWVTWRRVAGISKPALQLKPLRGLSVSRGLTAASLLLQQLKGK